MKPNEWEFDGWVLFYLWLVIVLWCGYVAGALLWFGGSHNAGEFGDLFGCLTSLFSGAGVALLVGTLLLQRKELRLQREEIAESRVEMQRQADSLDAQRELLV